MTVTEILICHQNMGDVAHDVLENGTILGVEEAWDRIKIAELSDFVPVVNVLPPVLLSAAVAIHLVAGCRLLRNLETCKARLFLQSVFTLVCPPVFADWEDFQEGNSIDRLIARAELQKEKKQEYHKNYKID